MAQNRPNKPSVTLPDNFGGVKSEFSSTRISNGYESSTPEIVEGGNLNYMLDGLFQNTKYMRTVLDYVRDTPVGRMFWVNSNGQMDYIQPAIIATDTEFNTGTATSLTPNVKQVADKFNNQQTQINQKANTSAVVTLTGTQSISGTKTFLAKTNMAPIELYPVDSGSPYIDFHYNNSTSDYTSRIIEQASGDLVVTTNNFTINANAFARASDTNGSIVTTVNKSKSANGYFKLGNGLIIQWGRTSMKTETTKTITFPTPFTSTNYSVCLTGERYTSTSVSKTDDLCFTYNAISNTAVDIFPFDAGENSYTAYVRWMAIGY